MLSAASARWIAIGLIFTVSFNFLHSAFGEKPTRIDRLKRAEAIHNIGLSYAMNDKYAAAISHFRTACRLAPENANYLNDLGVTEMRIDQFLAALKHISQAMKLDPDMELTKKNLLEVKRFVSPADFDEAMSPNTISANPQKHHLKAVRELTVSHELLQSMHSYAETDIEYNNESITPSMNDLIEVYYKRGSAHKINDLLSRPFVIRNAAQQWGWRLKALTAKMLSDKFGKLKADFYPHNMQEESVFPLMTNLDHALHQLELPDGVYDVDVLSGGATYIQWNMDELSWLQLLHILNASIPKILDDRYWLKKCFPLARNRNLFSIKTHWRMLLIGNENAGMFNHRDTLSTSSWQIQLKGEKRWHICSPEEEIHLYTAGAVDCFSPDYSKYPSVLNASCYDVTVGPGDFIYYPNGYWHQTKNLSPVTVSITDTMVTSAGHKDIAKELSNECKGIGNKGRTIFAPDASMCSSLQKCYSYWDDMYSTTADIYDKMIESKHGVKASEGMITRNGGDQLEL